MRTARQAVTLGPRNSLVWNALGVVLDEVGDRAGAAAAFEKALELDPENPAVNLNLASAYARLGDTEKSAAAMERYRQQTAVPR